MRDICHTERKLPTFPTFVEDINVHPLLRYTSFTSGWGRENFYLLCDIFQIIIGMGFMYSEIQLAMSGQNYQLGPPLHYGKPTSVCWIPIRFHTINYSYMMGGQANGQACADSEQGPQWA